MPIAEPVIATTAPVQTSAQFQAPFAVVGAPTTPLIVYVVRDTQLVFTPVGDARHDPTALRERFAHLADEWREQTKFWSSVTQRTTHPSYLRIIAMGPAAVPMLLEELEREPEHWF